MSNPGNVAGGHKANLNNPNTSEESKENSKAVLDELNNSGEIDTSGGEKNPGNVAGGLKATTKNPNVSQEAKDSAAERLSNLGQ